MTSYLNNLVRQKERRTKWVKSSKKCIKCGEKFTYTTEDCFWNENGMSSTKLVRCTCGCIQAIKYGKLHDVNKDERYYK